MTSCPTFFPPSVPHVHTHIIPRRTSDLPNSDDIYSLIESDAGDLGKIFREQHTEKEKKPSTPEAVAASINEELVLDNAGIATSIAAEGASLSVTGRPKFPTPPADHLRKPRTVVEMEKEARTLARFMEAVDGEGS